MKLKCAIIAVMAALAVASCGKKGGPKGAGSGAAADVEAASPLDKPFHLGDAKELDVDKFFALFPSHLEATYEKKYFDKKLGATVVEGLKLGAATNDAIAIDRAEFYGVNLAMIDQIKAAEGAPLDAPMRCIFDQIRLYGVKAASTDEDAPGFSVGAIEFDQFGLREGGVPKETKASGIAALFNAFEAAGVYAKDIRLQGHPNGEAGDLKFAAGDARLVGIGGGKLNAFLARNVEFSTEQSKEAADLLRGAFGPAGAAILSGPLRNLIAPDRQRVTADYFIWRNIDMSGWLDWGLKGETPPITARNLVNLGELRIGNAQSFIGEKRASTAPEIIVSDIDFEWLAPSKIRAAARGVSYDYTAYLPDDAKEEIAVMKAHGLDKAKADSTFSYDWSADRGNAALKSVFTSKALGDFNLDLVLAGLELEKISAAEESGRKNAAAELAKIKSISLLLADHGLLDTIFELAAVENGAKTEDLREAAPSFLKIMKLQIQGDNPRTAGFLDAVADFIEKGGTLEIKAAPKSPVALGSLAEMRKPDDAATALSLSVEQKN